MADLIIVGNGFDLAHGIQSRYSDFRGFLELFDKSAIDSLESLYPTRACGKMLLWSDFETSLENPDLGWAQELHELLNTLDDNPNWLMGVLYAPFVAWVRELSSSGRITLPADHPYKEFLREDNTYLSFRTIYKNVAG